MSSCKPKSLNFPLLLNITPTKKLSPLVPWSQTTILEKKLSLIAFRKILSKIFPEACIFSNTIMTCLITFVGTKSLNTKQCPEGLSLKIIPHYLRKHLWETLGMGKNPTQQPKNLLISPTRKTHLINLLLPLSKMSFLPHQIVIFILLPYRSFICDCSHCYYITFISNSGFMYICVMLILINWCLLNVDFSMKKALNGQSSLKQNFYSPHLSMLLEKPCFSLCLFSFYSHSLFYFKLHKISTDPTPVETSCLVS